MTSWSDAAASLRALVHDAVAAATATCPDQASELVGAIALYDSRKDELIRTLVSFGAARRAVAATPEVLRYFGEPEADRLTLQFAYLALTSCATGLSEQHAFDATLADFQAEAATPNWLARGVANVEFADAAPDSLGPLSCGDGTWIMGRSHQSLSELGFGQAIQNRLFDDWGSGFGASSLVLVAESSMPKSPDNLLLTDRGDLLPRAHYALTALRLLAPGALALGPMYVTRVARFNVGLGGIRSVGTPRPAVLGSRMQLSADLAARARPVGTQLKSLLESDALADNVTLSLRTFSASYDRPGHAPGDSVVDLVTALEALLGTDQEIAFRLAFRTASILAADDASRVDLFARVRAWYDLRSKLVHGATIKAKHQALLTDFEPLRRLLAQLLLGFVQLSASPGHAFDREFFQSRLDSALLSAEGRDGLRAAMRLL